MIHPLFLILVNSSSPVHQGAPSRRDLVSVPFGTNFGGGNDDGILQPPSMSMNMRVSQNRETPKVLDGSVLWMVNVKDGFRGVRYLKKHPYSWMGAFLITLLMQWQCLMLDSGCCLKWFTNWWSAMIKDWYWITNSNEWLIVGDNNQQCHG